MIVVQMQPSFANTPLNDAALRAFVQRWSGEFPLAIELRSMSWREPSVLEFLQSHDVAMVSNDLHDVPDLERAAFDTSDYHAYIRLIGRHDGTAKDHVHRPQTQARAWWVGKIAAMAERGVRNIYVVANNNYEGHSPATLRTLMAELDAAGVAVAAAPGWPTGQANLF